MPFKSRPTSTLADRAGRLLYGRFYRTALAKDLLVSAQTVGHYATGGIGLTKRRKALLLRAVTARIEKLNKLAAELMA